ncbi:MAG TPA: DinB family protein [Blastocatellia bacterium]|nr:DinB family protein [Blastocatellia bacterium]
MAKNDKNRKLSDLLAEADAVARNAQQVFGNLTPQQINWQPGERQWSVGQCFDHLITANRAYFPIFEKIIKGEKKNSLWERMPLVPGFFGRLLIKALQPEATRKLKAPQVFQPSSSAIDGDIINRFIEQQNELTRFMRATAGMDLQKIIITSPVSSLVTYNLMDCYDILITHEKRHFMQAERILGTPGFPAFAERKF